MPSKLLPCGYRVKRHHRPSNVQLQQQLGYGGDFIGLIVRLLLPPHRLVMGRPSTNPINGSFVRSRVQTAAQAFAVNGYDFATAEFRYPTLVSTEF